MPTSAIKDLLKKWEAVRAMVLEWHPNQADVSRVGDLYNNNAIDYFWEILKKREKQSTLDMDRPYLFFFDLMKCASPKVLVTGCLTPQVCVKHCPNETFLANENLADTEDIRKKLICKYGIKKEGQSLQNLLNDGHCATLYLKSFPIFGRCLPDIRKLAPKDPDKPITDKDDNVIRLGNDELLVDSIVNATGSLAQFLSLREMGSKIFSDFKASWHLLLLGLVLSMVVSLIWIVLMRWLAGVMVWLSAVLVLGFLGFGCYYSTTKYLSLKNVPGSDAKLTITFDFKSYLALQDTWLAFAITTGVVFAILFLILIFLRKRIVIAIALIKEASSDIIQLEEGVWNAFRWNWIERRDGNGDTISTWCKKINVAGQAYCVFCNSVLKYGGEGFKAFTNHSKTVTHIKYSKCIRHSMTLSNYANSKSTDDLLETDARPLDIVTRKARQEVLITSFIAENSLSFNVAPNLIELCEQLSRNQTALNSLEMSRTTACYKMKYGLAKTIKENIIKTLKETPFSLNLDESTSNAQESILAILVQFYDNNQNEVVVHHFASLKMESCNSEAVFKAVVNTIEDNNIPWANLISVLMDSCNTMRGKKRALKPDYDQTKHPTY
ncbi:choline transporter-like protein 2 [Trichonephila clavipes]|nr:choline transporter-like protein 2 [Trichonephila clavipes]